MHEGIYVKFEIAQGVCGQQIFLVDCATYAELSVLIKKMEEELGNRKIKVIHCWRMQIRPLNVSNFDFEFETLLEDVILQIYGKSNFGTLPHELWEQCKLLREAPKP